MDVMENSTIEQNYEAQCDNLRKQISILQDKVSYYKKDNAFNNAKLLQQIKAIEQKEGYFLREIELYQAKVEEMDNAIHERDEKILSLESSLSQLKEKINQERNQLLAATSTQKENITNANSSLMQEVTSLKSKLVELKDQNNQLNNELVKTKEEMMLFDQDNTILLQKIQEYEDTQHVLSNEKNQMEVSFIQKNNECINNEKLILNQDSQITEYTRSISNELSSITQWIDTYLGISYPSNYEVPSLLTFSLSTSLPLIGSSITALKKALESAKMRIMNEQNILEAFILKQKKDISDLVIARERKQNDINVLRTDVLELKEQLYVLQQDNENYLSEHSESKSMLNTFQSSIETMGNDNNQFLRSIIALVKTDIEEIMRDPAMKSYSAVFLIKAPLKKAINTNSLQFSFEDLIERVMHFVSLLIEDLKAIKNDNDVLSSDSLNRKSLWLKELNELNSNIFALKKELSVLESSLSQLKDENNLLVSQVSLLETTIQSKDEIIKKITKDKWN